MDKVKVGVVGLGWIAQVVHLPILKKLPEAEIVAVCDRDRSRVSLVAEKFGIKKFFTDINQMMEIEEIEAVIVSTSTDAHKEATIPALNAGKDVLVEKPIARHYSEALEMAEAARAANRKLMVGMNQRFRPDMMILKSFLEGKEIGDIFYVKAGWLRKNISNETWLTQKSRSGGGVFIDLGLVMFDVAYWMMGYPEVRRVTATHYSHRTKEVEDTSLSTITMKNGSVMNIEVSWSVFVEDDVYYCDIFGTEGSATLSPLKINKELHGNLVNLAPAKLESHQHLFKRSYENELKHFLGAVRNVHPVISTGDEAVQRMRIVDAVYKSVRTGREVTLS
ncbi:MAG: Gfo/Idh/MocA family oxidoreductase [Ignavibacteriae bacterium]|nr:Gfo/Idh/MocA family oxidoreductase [Ignavibacteriota bacterium]